MKKAVIVNCFGWYDKRMRPIKEVCEELGYRTYVINSDYSHMVKGDQVKFSGVEYIHVRPYKKNLSVTRILSHLEFAKKLYVRINEIKPDIIYAMIPPNTTGEECVKYKMHNPKVKLILDIIDLWPESIPIERFNDLFPIRNWKNIRVKCIRNADHIVTECRYYQELLKDEIEPERCTTLYLFKVRTKKNEECPVQYKRHAGHNIVIAYLGSINSIIDISAMTNITREFVKNEYQVLIKIIGNGESKTDLINRLKSAGAVVEDHGAIFDENEKIRILSSCDLAFNLMKKSVKVGLTTKSMDYLSCGIPIINNLPGDNKMMAQEGAGFQYEGNARSLVKEIEESQLEEMHKTTYNVFLKYLTEEGFRENARAMLNKIIF